jgi:hypothetical protein
LHAKFLENSKKFKNRKDPGERNKPEKERLKMGRVAGGIGSESKEK